MTADELIARLEDVIRYIVAIDQPNLAGEPLERLVLHLTGAVFVEVSPLLPAGELDRMATEINWNVAEWLARRGEDPAAAAEDSSDDTPA